MFYPHVKVGKSRKSSFVLGNKVILYHNVGIYLESDKAAITIGDNSYLNQRTEIKCASSITIGRHTAIAWDCTITDSDYHSICEKNTTEPIVIGDHVRIGCKSIILKGVTIGNGSVVAAGSVVTKSVPENCLVAGVPAKIVKRNITWS